MYRKESTSVFTLKLIKVVNKSIMSEEASSRCQVCGRCGVHQCDEKHKNGWVSFTGRVQARQNGRWRRHRDEGISQCNSCGHLMRRCYVNQHFDRNPTCMESAMKNKFKNSQELEEIRNEKLSKMKNWKPQSPKEVCIWIYIRIMFLRYFCLTFLHSELFSLIFLSEY